jgi:hypothetical protein
LTALSLTGINTARLDETGHGKRVGKDDEKKVKKALDSLELNRYKRRLPVRHRLQRVAGDSIKKSNVSKI